ETTTVHWHGIRLPHAMDGVPGLIQKPIAPGDRFDFAFTPPDAGTFWYHAHDDSLVQMGRGLAGALLVDETEPPTVDRELQRAWIDVRRLTARMQQGSQFSTPLWRIQARKGHGQVSGSHRTMLMRPSSSVASLRRGRPPQAVTCKA